MRLWPRSLFARLLGIGILSTLVALLVAGFAIGHVLERFVMHALDDRLDTQVAVLAGALGPDGAPRADRVVNLPGFGEAGSGWVWQVTTPAGRHYASGPGIGLTVPPALPPGPPGPPGRLGPDDHRPRPGDAADGARRRLHSRTLIVASAAGPVTIVAAGPRRIVAQPIREAMAPLLLSLGLLGAGLVAATLVQLRLGLRPLRAMQAALAAIRVGEARAIPPDQPRELVPLATELNALIAQNEAGLAHARQHVANLAHGLKTPLAALALRLGEEGRDPDGSLGGMVAQIDRRVRHHLGRARAVAPGGGARQHTPLRPAIADLVAVLQRIHADRPVAADIRVPEGLAVAVDPQDLDEMLGNLLDNGWRHAAGHVRIAASRHDAAVRITIADDGPGLDEAAMAEAMLPGRRLDERGDGHGFGLPIARELAELNGGRLELGARDSGPGLVVAVTLPA